MPAKKRPTLMPKPLPKSSSKPQVPQILKAAQPSVALRTLRAKLQVLKRPTVWGSLLLLLLPLLFLANYWNNLASPEVASDLSPTAPSLGPADGSADRSADGSPDSTVLPSLLQPNLLNALLASPNQTAELGRNAKPPQSTQPSQPLGGAPVAVPALFPVGLSAASQANPATANRATDPGSSTATAQSPAVSPLQAALDRRVGLAETGANAASAAQSGSSAQPTNVTNLYEFGSLPGGQSLGSMRPAPTGLGQPFVPQTSPALGTTGYTLPPALRTPAATSVPQILPVAPTQQPMQLPTVTTPNRALSPAYGSAVPTPTVLAPAPQVPFSVPRVPPGRFIGNGEINTFSNP